MKRIKDEDKLHNVVYDGLKIQRLNVPDSYVAYIYSDNLTVLENIYALWSEMKLVNKTLFDFTETINAMVDFLNGEGLQAHVTEKLTEWLEDGTLESIINDSLMNKKLDKEKFYELVKDIETDYDEIERMQKDMILDNENGIIRIASFNVESRNNISYVDDFNYIENANFMRNVIMRLGANVVGLQEITNNDLYFNMLDFIKNNSLRFYNEPLKVDSTRPFISSTTPIISNIPLYNNSGGFINTSGSDLKRMWVKSEITFSGEQISIYNVHLDHISPIPQIEYLSNILLQDNNDKLIVMGDFNTSMSVMHPSVVNMINDNSLKRSNVNNKQTYKKVEGSCIDEIFYRGFNLMDFETYGDNNSDHFTLISRLEVIK